MAIQHFRELNPEFEPFHDWKTHYFESIQANKNMYLRWMVRDDQNGVDFGIWKSIKPGELICPLDVHVERIARKLGLLSRKQNDWKSASELTENLKLLDPYDPVKYDYALFGMGVIEKYQ